MVEKVFVSRGGKCRRDKQVDLIAENDFRKRGLFERGVNAEKKNAAPCVALILNTRGESLVFPMPVCYPWAS